jgi:hypothetical protein
MNRLFQKGAKTGIKEGVESGVKVGAAAGSKQIDDAVKAIKLSPEQMVGIKNIQAFPKAIDALGPGLKVQGFQLKNGGTIIYKAGDKVDNVIPMTKEGLSPAAASSLDDLAKKTPGSTLVNAGKAVKGQITFTRVAVVAGGTIAAVILIDDDSGEKIAENLAETTLAFIEPFLPSLLSSLIPLCLLLSFAAAAMVMFKMV